MLFRSAVECPAGDDVGEEAVGVNGERLRFKKERLGIREARSCLAVAQKHAVGTESAKVRELRRGTTHGQGHPPPPKPASHT